MSPAKVKRKGTKSKGRSQAPVKQQKVTAKAKPDGRARAHTHPSQTYQPDAVKHRPVLVVRAPKDVIQGLTELAQEKGVSRNTLIVDLMQDLIDGKL